MYFAAMRELVGHSEEELDTNAKDAQELLDEIFSKYDFSFSKEHLKVAINEEYAAFSEQLKENDTVVFIPPVAGG